MCLKPNSHTSVPGRDAPFDTVRTFTHYRKANVRPKAVEVPTGEGYVSLVSDRVTHTRFKCTHGAESAVRKCSEAHTVAIKSLLSFRRATFLMENNKAPVRSFTAISLDLYIADNSFY